MQTAPGLFLLTLGLLVVILLVGLTSLSTVGSMPSETNYAAVGLVFAGLLGIAFFTTRRRRRR